MKCLQLLKTGTVRQWQALLDCSVELKDLPVLLHRNESNKNIASIIFLHSIYLAYNNMQVEQLCKGQYLFCCKGFLYNFNSGLHNMIYCHKIYI